MARVDPDDDTLLRFIVRHYRYDPQRRERRHVVVAAFDNEEESLGCMSSVNAGIAQRRDRGERVDPCERVSSVTHEPGYRRRAANGRLVWRAIRHGAAGTWMNDLELPSNMFIMVRAQRPAI